MPETSVSSTEAPIVVTLIIVFSAVMIISRARSLLEKRRSTWLDLATIASLVVMVFYLSTSISSWDRSILSFNINLDADLFAGSDPLWGIDEYIWALIAFAVLPLIFQFVDMTAWQRIAAVKPQQTEDKDKSIVLLAQKGLKEVILESPLSWLLPILMGLLAAPVVGSISLADEWDSFLALAVSGTGLEGIIFSVLITGGMVSIFMSTADSLLSAVGYTIAYDIHPESRRISDNHTESTWESNPKDARKVINYGRLSASIIILVIAIIFFILESFTATFGGLFIGLFLSFFAPMVSFAPSIIIPALFGRRAHSVAAWLSIVFGASSGILLGVLSIFYLGVYQWVSIVFPIVISMSIYLIGLIFGYKIEEVNND